MGNCGSKGGGGSATSTQASTQNANAGIKITNKGTTTGNALHDVYEQAISTGEEADYVCKLLILGDSGVGKSSLMVRFSDDTFSEAFSTTIGIDFKIRKATVKGKKLKVQIWDTAGQERFRTITRSYYKGIHGYILVYEITNRKSFEHVAHWLKEIDENGIEGIPKILIGNKCDLNHLREVEEAEGKAYADSIGVPFVETSAKSGVAVKEMFESMLERFVDSVTKYQEAKAAQK